MERATSTGLLCTFANLGCLLPAIVGPLIVAEPNANWIQENENGKKGVKEQIESYLLMCTYTPSKLLHIYLINNNL